MVTRLIGRNWEAARRKARLSLAQTKKMPS
jgi:hypothetical protein